MTRFLDEVLSQCGLPVPGSGRPEVVAFAGRGDARPVNLLVLRGGEPWLFCKTARDPGRADLVLEHDALLALYAGAGHAPGVPRPLGLVEVRDRHVLVQEALAGVPVSVRVRGALRTRRSVRSAVARSTAWLSELQSRTTSGERPLLPPEVMLGLESRLRRRSLWSRDIATAVSAACTMATQLDDTRLPLAARHGDYWAGNVLLHRETVNVVDWQHYSASGSPLHDLVFFLMTTAAVAPSGLRGGWRDGRDAFREAFCRSGWYGRICWGMVVSRLAGWGIERDVVPLAVLWTVAELGAGDGRDLAPVGPGGTDWDASCVDLLESGVIDAAHRPPMTSV